MNHPTNANPIYVAIGAMTGMLKWLHLGGVSNFKRMFLMGRINITMDDVNRWGAIIGVALVTGAASAAGVYLWKLSVKYVWKPVGRNISAWWEHRQH